MHDPKEPVHHAAATEQPSVPGSEDREERIDAGSGSPGPVLQGDGGRVADPETGLGVCIRCGTPFTKDSERFHQFFKRHLRMIDALRTVSERLEVLQNQIEDTFDDILKTLKEGE